MAGVGGLVLKVTIFEWGPAEKKTETVSRGEGLQNHLRTKVLEGARLSVHNILAVASG